MEADSGKLAEQNHCGLSPRTKTSRQTRTQFFDGEMHDWLPDKSQAIRANRSKTSWEHLDLTNWLKRRTHTQSSKVNIRYLNS